MKIKLLLSILVSSLLLQSVSHEELFLQANKHFFEGQFEKARHCYEQLPHKNSVIWHNIGNCYYNENNCTKALVCWRRAQPDATFNQLGQLLDLERVVLEKYNFPCDGIFMRTTKRVILALPKILIQLLLLLCFLLFLSLFYQCCIQKTEQLYQLSCKKRYFIILLLSIVILLLLLAAKEKFMQEKQGVVLQQKISVHIGPEASFQQKMTLPEGCIVQVLDEKSGMTKIDCPQGSGWITSDSIEIV